MDIIRGLHNLEKHTGSAVTIGNFDGVHVGHQSIIKRLVSRAKSLGVPSVLISFSPTPQSFFGHAQATISNFKQKHLLLSQLGVDKHLVVNFNQQFSELSAESFIQTVLIDKLSMRYCLIGDEFRFGAKRQGDFDLLKTYSKQTPGFEVENTQSILCNNCRASSSNIRTLLKAGDFETATQMLGREFSIAGKIIHGQQMGRTINFPTINIPIKREISPLLGVFAVSIKLNNQSYHGVCNLGRRPTVNGEKILLEVFIFDFSANVYGQYAEVFFKHKIRDEQKFDSFDRLKQQIKKDTQAAKSFFNLPSSAMSGLP